MQAPLPQQLPANVNHNLRFSLHGFCPWRSTFHSDRRGATRSYEELVGPKKSENRSSSAIPSVYDSALPITDYTFRPTCTYLHRVAATCTNLRKNSFKITASATSKSLFLESSMLDVECWMFDVHFPDYRPLTSDFRLLPSALKRYASL